MKALTAPSWVSDELSFLDHLERVANIGAVRSDSGEVYGLVAQLGREFTYLAAQAASPDEEAIKAAEMGVWDWDIPSDVSKWNDHEARIFGIIGEPRFGSHRVLMDCVHPDDIPSLRLAMDDACKSRTRFDHSFRVCARDGELRWVHCKGGFRYDEKGRAVRMLGMATDFSAQVDRRRLAEGEAVYRTLVEHADCIIARFDRTLRHTFVNSAIERVTGRKACEFIGKTNRELGMPEDLCASWERSLREVFEMGTVREIDFEFPSEDGVRYFESRLVPERSGSGRVESVMSIVHDVTRVKLATLAARRSQEAAVAMESSLRRYEILARHTRDVILFVRLDGSLADVNLAAVECYGYTREELLGLTIFHLRRPTERALVEEQIATASEEGLRFETVHRRKNGSEFAVEVCSEVTSFGAEQLLVSVVRDISERKKAEDALRNERILLRRIIDSDPNLVFVKDRGGRFVLVNQATAQLYQTTPEALVGKHNSEMLTSGEAYEQYDRIDQLCLLTGHPMQLEETHRLPDGSYINYLTWKTAVRLPDGELAVLGICQDITARKAAEAETAAASRAVQEANAAKDRFLAVLSHELRTPLAPVLYNAEMLETDSSLPDSVRETARVIRRNAELEGRLIDDLLDLTRITHGKLELRCTQIDAHRYIRSALQICRPDAAARKISLVIQLAARDSAIYADMARFQQVIWNLVRNSIKFTPPEGRIEIVTANPEPQIFEIRVVDTGVGIPAEALAGIFQPFEQGGRSITQRFGGLGLGLTITKSLVEAHGGSIIASSQGTGKGACFTVKLPVSSHGPADAATKKEEDLGGCTILLVEDHSDTLSALSRSLRRSGYYVIEAASGAEALAAAEAQPLHGVVSDLGLPDISGIELIQKLKGMYRIWSIALSGYAMEDDIRQACAAGFDLHIVKPVRLQDLRSAIARLVQSTRT